MAEILEVGGNLTPAMKRPNETPSFGKDAIPRLVGWGSQMLPGAVFCETVRQTTLGRARRIAALTFVKPSIKMTTMSKTEENIPSTEVMESHDSGKNTVGKNLEGKASASYAYGDGKPDEHNQTKNLVEISGVCRCDCFYVKHPVSCAIARADERRGSPRESPYKVTRATVTVKSSRQKSKLMKCLDFFPNALRPMSA